VVGGEAEHPNDARATEREDIVDENGEQQELFAEFIVGGLVAVFIAVVVEIEDFEILPKVAPFARDEAHMDGGFGWEEGENVTQ